MAWVLAAALAAGITGDLRIAVVALFFLGRMAVRGGLSKGGGAAVALVAALFFAYGYTSIAAARKDVVRVFSASRRSAAPVVLDGWVCRFPYYRYGGAAFDLRTRVGGVEQTVFVQSREFLISYGDSVRVRGAWKTPGVVPFEKWAERLVAMGVSGEFRAVPGGVERLGGAGGDWARRRLFYPCHDTVRRTLSRGLGSRSGIPIALLIGERGYLDRRANDAFKSLGISHLLALSGLHLGFVAAALVAVLRLFRRRGPLLVLAALALYVSVVGPIVSLYRAFVMASVLILASLVKRPLTPLGALVQAFIVVLLVYPHSFYSVGFQLSFMATFAVLVSVRNLSPPASRSLAARSLFWVRSSLQVSLAAQLFVAPVIFHYFGRLSLLSPVTTLAFVLPVAFVLFYSAVAAAASAAFPVVGPAVFAGLERVTTLFQHALVWSAGALPAGVSFGVPNVWVYYGGLCLLFRARGRWWLRIAALGVLALSFFLGRAHGELS